MQEQLNVEQTTNTGRWIKVIFFHIFLFVRLLLLLVFHLWTPTWDH
jgi:hypothetical protein